MYTARFPKRIKFCANVFIVNYIRHSNYYQIPRLSLSLKRMFLPPSLHPLTQCFYAYRLVALSVPTHGPRPFINSQRLPECRAFGYYNNRRTWQTSDEPRWSMHFIRGGGGGGGDVKSYRDSSELCVLATENLGHYHPSR